MSAEFTPTHVVPANGMRAWETPDGTGPPAATLDPYLEVEVVERRADWARIVCSNGWGAWVDGRRLSTAGRAPPGAPVSTAGAPVAAATPIAAATPAASVAATAAPTRPRTAGAAALRGVGVCTLAGVALVVIGSFLDWWSVTADGFDLADAPTAWDVSAEFLITGDGLPGGSGLDVGPVLLVVVVLLLPLLVAKPFPAWVVALVSLVPIAAGLAGLLRSEYQGVSFDPAIGLILVLAGGALIATDAGLMFLASSRSRA